MASRADARVRAAGWPPPGRVAWQGGDALPGIWSAVDRSVEGGGARVEAECYIVAYCPLTLTCPPCRGRGAAFEGGV